MDTMEMERLSKMTENLEAVSEDTVQCSFFSTHVNCDSISQEHLCDSINTLIEKLSADYIWHHDEFKVYVPMVNETKDIPAHIVSTVCFGDNLEDEWFIVYLVLEITKIHSDIVVQIKDGDGEFLLIEAADYLPSWANPDNTDNRVFIYQGNIHLIPPSLADADDEISLKDAIQIVTEHAEETKTTNLQQAIMKRISDYPNTFKENFHNTVVKLPLDIAALLKTKPSLISSLVTMYCNHDFIDEKACINMKFENCVATSIKFTKFLFAKLVHAKLIRNIKLPKVNVKDKKSVLGIKLAYGYQMIMSKLSEDMFSSRQFHKFKKILTDSGYFKGNLERSQQYDKLMEKAKDHYLNTESSDGSHVSHIITETMKTDKFNKFKCSFQNNEVSDSDLVEDSEDWLNIHPEQLNDLLNSRYGKPSNLKNDDIISSNTITSELSNFLKETSDFQGIESKDDIDKASEESIDFDPDKFVNSLKSMLNIMTSDSSSKDDLMISDFSDDEDEFDMELNSKLHTDDSNMYGSENVYRNIIQSMKEEGACTGPSSNILKIIGINKTDVLDSDDDIE